MKKEMKLTILIILLVIGVGMIIWSATIMRNYEGYMEALKGARQAAMPQIITGLVVCCIAYVLTFIKSK